MFKGNLRIILVVTAVVLSIVFIGLIFFLRGKIIMEQQIDLRLTSAAQLAAQQFEAAQIEAISQSRFVDSGHLFAVSRRLEQIRNSVPNVDNAYILKRGDVPGMLEFVADANIVLPPEHWDRNRDGMISSDERPAYPGDTLSVRHIDALQAGAFVRPTVGQSIHDDRQIAYISGYAPIRRANGEVVAILGLDMSSADYLTLTESLISPIVLLLILLMAVFIGGYMGLFFWKRRVEVLELAERQQAAFIELMINQLATPLSIFRWWLEQYQRHTIPARQQYHEFADAVEQMDLVVRAMENAQSEEHDDLDSEPEMTSLKQLVYRIVDEQRPRLQRNRQQPNIIINDDLVFPFDEKMTAAVLRELIDNAIDYSGDDTMITIRAYRLSGRVQVDVQDQGQGIPDDDKQLVLEKFQRGSNASEMQPVGRGLGLYLAEGIVNVLGGRLWLRSEVNEGTTVSFTLPVPE